MLNNNDCIERYYYWNSERDPSKLYKNGSLTEAGQYYASINLGLGYNGKYNFVPTTPPQYGPTKFTKILSTGKTRLSWHDANGEYNQLMEVQMKDDLGRWVVLDTIPQKETAFNYSYEIDNDDENVLYRLRLIDLYGTEYLTYDELLLGDAFEIDGQLYFAGGNMFPNGDFDLGFTDWTSGTGEPLKEPAFQVVADGGYQGGQYLQSHLNGNVNTEAAVKKVVDLQEGQNYVFRIASRNSGNYTSFYFSSNGMTLSKAACKATNDNDWHTNTFTFNAGEYTKGILSCRSLAAKAQIDGLQLRQLFPTREEAMADGIEKAKFRAEAQKAFNTAYPFLNDDLDATISERTNFPTPALADHLRAIRIETELPILTTTLQAIAERPCPDYDEMLVLLNNTKEAQTARDVISNYDRLQALMQENLAFSRASRQPKTPSFANEKSDGWQIKIGTYKDGEQRAATKHGKTCFNAWWSTTRQDATMEINQTLTNLPEGYYQLECKAMTEHFCISDQHGYLRSGGKEAVTPTISIAYFDMPVEEHWDTLTTTPIYVEPKGSLTIGFASSKQGAEAGKWHTFGDANGTSDNREGWWCATDFVLKYHPIDDVTLLKDLKDLRDFRDIKNTWFDLCGRKWSKPAKGVFIQNRKKIVK